MFRSLTAKKPATIISEVKKDVNTECLASIYTEIYLGHHRKALSVNADNRTKKSSKFLFNISTMFNIRKLDTCTINKEYKKATDVTINVTNKIIFFSRII